MYEPVNTTEGITTGEAAALSPLPDESADIATVVAAALTSRLRGYWVDQFNASHVPRRTVVKDVRGLPQLGAVCALVPAATVIVLMRHPFDIAASVVRLGWYDPALEPGDAFVTEVQSWCQRHSAAVRDVRAAHVEWCTYEELSAQTDGQSLEELIELVTTRQPTWRGLVSTRATREQRSATDFAGAPVTIEDAWRDRAYEHLVATGWSELYGRDSQQLQPVKQFVAGRRN